MQASVTRKQKAADKAAQKVLSAEEEVQAAAAKMAREACKAELQETQDALLAVELAIKDQEAREAEGEEEREDEDDDSKDDE